MVIIIKRASKRYIPKSLYIIYLYLYFVMKVVTIDLLNYDGQYSCLWHFFHLLHWFSWKVFLPYLFKFLLSFFITKMLLQYFQIDYIYIVFEISCVHVCNANRISNCLSTLKCPPFVWICFYLPCTHLYPHMVL
jgi:hypothetical protein